MSEKNSMSKEKLSNASRKSGGLPLHKITNKSDHLEEKYKEMRYCIPPRNVVALGKTSTAMQGRHRNPAKVFLVASKNHNRKVV